jgi:curved DNA-binding protein CbpA
VTVPNFSEEARFAFGVMMKHSADGRGFAGVRMDPFEYTGRKMLGIAAYEKAVAEEVDKTYKKKGGVWAKVREPTDEEEADERYVKGGEYFLKYGDTWRDGVDRFLKIVSVQRLVDHIIAEGDKAYAGTPYAGSWVIGHDALSQFTEKGAQEYLARRGFGPGRLLGPQGSTNEGTRYERRSVGDSPELMPLDSNLFSDLVYGVKMHRAATWSLPPEDPLKFKYGTHAEVATSLRRTWEMCPTSDRIVEDIQRFPGALDKIIAAQGAYVPELCKRTGRRTRVTRCFDKTILTAQGRRPRTRPSTRSGSTKRRGRRLVGRASPLTRTLILTQTAHRRTAFEHGRT